MNVFVVLCFLTIFFLLGLLWSRISDIIDVLEDMDKHGFPTDNSAPNFFEDIHCTERGKKGVYDWQKKRGCDGIR
jgi:hypothetical protein